MPRRKPKKLGQGSQASNPGRFPLSKRILKRLRPDLFGIRGYFYNRKLLRKNGFTEIDAIEQQLVNGDCRAAIVVSTRPCLIGAYSDELDCVAMLYLMPNIYRMFKFQQGERLLTVNSYNQHDHSDLAQGPNARNVYTGFNPIIADLVCSDPNALEQRKQTISGEEWLRVLSLSREYRTKYPRIVRNGLPGFPSTLKPVKKLV